MSGGLPSSNMSCSYTKPFDSQFNSCHKAADITLAAVPSTGIKLNSCPQESDILVYQATIWGQSKLYLQQKAKQSVSSCYERDGSLNLSAATQKVHSPTSSSSCVASDRLATAIIIHLWLYSIHKDNVIDYSILKTRQLMKKNTQKFLIGVSLHWSLVPRMFYFYSMVRL